jgi:hypothetical protein
MAVLEFKALALVPQRIVHCLKFYHRAAEGMQERKRTEGNRREAKKENHDEMKSSVSAARTEEGEKLYKRISLAVYLCR